MANDAAVPAGFPASSDPKAQDGWEQAIQDALRLAGASRDPHSCMALFPADTRVIELLHRSSTAAPVEGVEHAASPHSFNAYVAKRVDRLSLLEETYSLASLRGELERCRTVIRHFHAGQVRRGLRGKAANWIALISQRILNWFITPSLMFDRSTEKALSEITCAIDRMQRQITIIAAETQILRKQAADRTTIDDANRENS